MKLSNYKLILFSIAGAAALSNCASQRMLTVKSDPADAEVCLKGQPGSKYLTGQKQCVGSTPFIAEKVELTLADGTKKKVSFNQIEDDTEQFYLVISREGYAPQSVMVPSWEHFIALKPEAQPQVATAIAPATTPAADEELGTVKISSSPVGALVYVNDYIKGNTPYTVSAKNGQVLRIKLEHPGYSITEKSATVEGGKTLEVNLELEQQKTTNVMADKPATKTEVIVTQAAQ